MKIDSGSMNLLALAKKEADTQGWTKVSKVVWTVIPPIPDELLEKRPSKDDESHGGHVKLTEKGEVAVALYQTMKVIPSLEQVNKLLDWMTKHKAKMNSF